MGQRAGAKKKGQETKLRKGKNKGGWDKLPLMSDFITKQTQSIHECKTVHTGAPPQSCLLHVLTISTLNSTMAPGGIG